MCGIIGYSGSNTNAVELLLEGLEKVEYRGYDSAGIAFVTDSGIQIEKKEGNLGIIKNRFFKDRFRPSKYIFQKKISILVDLDIKIFTKSEFIALRNI